MANIQSISVPLELSVDGTTWKTLVCLTDVGLALSRDVNTTDTYCGPISGLGSLQVETTIDAVCETAPSGTQVSYKDMLGWMHAGTLIHFRLQDDATGVNFYHKGTCNITNLELTGTSGEILTFSSTMTMSGELDITP